MNSEAAAEALTLSQLPLFPLQTVLFPGGWLPLRIFEVRYLDMIGRCHKAGAPFGVVCLSEGSEVIQVAGIIRPEDVAPNNTVQSRRLANAQITYRGTGDLAAASRAGWGTSALLKLWPF